MDEMAHNSQNVTRTNNQMRPNGLKAQKRFGPTVLRTLGVPSWYAQRTRVLGLRATYIGYAQRTTRLSTFSIKCLIPDSFTSKSQI